MEPRCGINRTGLCLAVAVLMHRAGYVLVEEVPNAVLIRRDMFELSWCEGLRCLVETDFRQSVLDAE